MTSVLYIFLLAVLVALAIPVGILCIECVAALLPTRKLPADSDSSPLRRAILVPAHNEEAGLAQTLKALKSQLTTNDRIIVVADNCNDDTALIARECGAIAIERTDSKRRGKGYALDFGVRYLEADPPDIVIVVDADCLVAPGALDALSRQARTTDRPAQAIYLMETTGKPRGNAVVSTLALLIKNWVRPRGLARLGLPCLLTGTGMAFPWKIIRDCSLAHGNIVEDMQLGLDLAAQGRAPMLCEDARVTGILPHGAGSAITQRTRWEHGHLRTSLTQAPRIFFAGLVRGHIGAVTLALDLCVPPLALLSLMLLMLLAGSSAAAMWLGLPWWLAIASGVCLALLGGCALISWMKFARRQIPLVSLLAIPFYVMWKIPLYVSFLARRQREWIRTDRSAAAVSTAPHDLDETAHEVASHL